MAAMSVVDDMVESEASVAAREVGASLSVALVPLRLTVALYDVDGGVDSGAGGRQGFDGGVDGNAGSQGVNGGVDGGVGSPCGAVIDAKKINSDC